jgi:hypothetical protein
MAKNAKDGRFRVDFLESAPGWTTAIIRDTKTGQMAQATASSPKLAESAAREKLRLKR